MKKTYTFSLEITQFKKLSDLAYQNKTNKSELVRQIFDEFLLKNSNKKDKK
jgi:predicted DNA-binding ribbon-helix-helix protein